VEFDLTPTSNVRSNHPYTDKHTLITHQREARPIDRTQRTVSFRWTTNQLNQWWILMKNACPTKQHILRRRREQWRTQKIFMGGVSFSGIW